MYRLVTPFAKAFLSACVFTVEHRSHNYCVFLFIPYHVVVAPIGVDSTAGLKLNVLMRDRQQKIFDFFLKNLTIAGRVRKIHVRALLKFFFGCDRSRRLCSAEPGTRQSAISDGLKSSDDCFIYFFISYDYRSR